MLSAPATTTTTTNRPPPPLQFRNPFKFQHVQVLGAGKQFTDSGPCVMLATPSMLQSGFSRELFEAWAGNPRNAVIIVDFAVQGTLARQLLESPQTVTTRDNRPVSWLVSAAGWQLAGGWQLEARWASLCGVCVGGSDRGADRDVSCSSVACN